MHHAPRSAPPEPGWGDLRRQLADAIAAAGDAASSAWTGCVSAGQMAHAIAVLRHLEAPLAAVHVEESYWLQRVAWAERDGFERGRAAASPVPRARPGSGPLRLVRGAVPAVLAVLALLGRALRPAGTAVRAHAAHAALASAPLAVAGAVTLGAAGYALAPYTGPVPHHRRPAVPAVRLAPVSADRDAVPPPARHARRRHRAAPAPRAPRHPAPPRGHLETAQADVVIAGPAGTGQLAVTAEGGPAAWTAVSSSPWVTLSAVSGVLQAGGQEIIAVTVRPGAPGDSAWITLAGYGQIQVLWGHPAGS